tara:strand:+ start:43 stop:342 length:300 start_codon:yes stop_codon:yes gene_type:complete
MPEEEKKQKYKYEKVAKKGYLYKNDRKREGTNDPDHKGKIIELDLNMLKDIADENGLVTLSVSGWLEEDQSGTPRVGLAVQKATPIESTETAEAAASPF